MLLKLNIIVSSLFVFFNSSSFASSEPTASDTFDMTSYTITTHVTPLLLFTVPYELIVKSIETGELCLSTFNGRCITLQRTANGFRTPKETAIRHLKK